MLTSWCVVVFFLMGIYLKMLSFNSFHFFLPPVIMSSSNIQYMVQFPDQSSQSYSFQLKQTITFQGCNHDDAQPVPATQQLSVDRTFVLYEKNEQVFRYAMTNKIGPVQGTYLLTFTKAILDRNCIKGPWWPVALNYVLRLCGDIYFIRRGKSGEIVLWQWQCNWWNFNE